MMTPTEIDLLLIGVVTADIVPSGRLLGGTVSFAAATATAFGLRTGILTSARGDEPLLAELPESVQVVSIPSEHTSTFENVYDNGARTQYIRSVSAPIRTEDVPEIWKSAPLVHVAPLVDEVAPNIFDLFPDAMTLLTPQGWLRKWGEDGRVWFKPWFDADVLRRVDIVVMSEEDIAEAPELEAKIAEVAPCLILTRGDKGGTCYYNGTPVPYDAVQVDDKYLTGAGDVFAASVLATLFRTGGDMHVAVQVASRMGAYATTRRGLQSAPTEDEVQSAMDLFSQSKSGKQT